jgi:hypothetical protein
MGSNDGTNEDNTSQLAHRSLQIQMFLSDSEFSKLAVLAIASHDSNRSEMTGKSRNQQNRQTHGWKF